MKKRLLYAQWQDPKNIGPVMAQLLTEAELIPDHLAAQSVEDFFSQILGSSF